MYRAKEESGGKWASRVADVLKGSAERELDFAQIGIRVDEPFATAAPRLIVQLRLEVLAHLPNAGGGEAVGEVVHGSRPLGADVHLERDILGALDPPYPTQTLEQCELLLDGNIVLGALTPLQKNVNGRARFGIGWLQKISVNHCCVSVAVRWFVRRWTNYTTWSWRWRFQRMVGPSLLRVFR